MTPTLAVMAAPDPDTCTPDQWDDYLASVDVAALTWAEVDEHRALVERYTARLLRESTTARAESTRLLDARDQTSADADVLSTKCRELHRQILDVGADVIAARRSGDRVAERHAREQETQLSEALALARAELATANLKAIQAALDAR